MDERFSGLSPERSAILIHINQKRLEILSISHVGNSLFVIIISVVAHVTLYRARGFLAVDARHTASLTEEADNSNKALFGFVIEIRGINLCS